MAGMIRNLDVVKNIQQEQEKNYLVKEKTHKSGPGHRAMIMTVNLEL